VDFNLRLPEDSSPEAKMSFTPVGLGPRSGDGALENTPTLTGPVAIDGRYELISLLGEGGMGSVYKARDLALDEIVALKTLKARFIDDEKAGERFREEVKLARRVTHRNVARTYDLGIFDGVPYFTMEYIEGQDLDSLLRRRGPLTAADFVDLARPICAGLAAAHDVGVIHRDLKPANVIVAADGRVVITDFGIARAAGASTGLTGEGPTLGTPAYMAPEQIETAQKLDHRADIYALGVMFFEMLSGTLPFEGKTALAMALARVVHEPRRLDAAAPGVPSELVELVAKCLKRNPAERFDRLEEISKVLEAIADGLQIGPASQRYARVTEELHREPQEDAGFAETLMIAPRSPTTIAVLPFRHGSAEEDAYTAEGLTEDLIDSLSRSPTLRVRPRGAVMSFKASTSEPREIGESLNVQVVVDGSLRRAGDALHVRVALISVHDGFQVWGRRFVASTADLFAISDEAATRIVEALGDALAQASAGPVDTDAIELYLQARQKMHSLWYSEMEPVIGLLEAALRTAPEDPRILSAAAMARARASFFDAAKREVNLELAERYARRAMALSPLRVEPRLALARVYFDRLEFRAALEMLREAVRIAPSNEEAHDFLGRMLRETGPAGEATFHLRASLEINPNLWKTRYELAQLLALVGSWQEVDEVLALPVDPEGPFAEIRDAIRSRTDLWRGEPRWIPDEFDLSRPPEGKSIRRGWHYRNELMLTRKISAGHQSWLDELVTQSHESSRFRLLAHQLRAEAYLYVAEESRAIGEIESAVGSGLIDLVWLQRCPLLCGLRDLPQHRDWVARIQARIDGT
jgi:eukaryotic-like serine/threonine-protein kinase